MKHKTLALLLAAVMLLGLLAGCGGTNAASSAPAPQEPSAAEPAAEPEAPAEPDTPTEPEAPVQEESTLEEPAEPEGYTYTG